jgi:gamma-glutamyl phosphate reductase
LLQTPRRASRQLVTLSGQARVSAMQNIASAIRQAKSDLIDANAADITAAAKS